jgi:glyoxylase-like metal-dependent hydrolase (beta-lactamase superfamily II)
MSQCEGVSRRRFLVSTSCFGAAYAVARMLPLSALAESLAQDPRVSPSPLVDKGFASTRKIGTGVYATVSDFSKGPQTLCNGGFLVGRDAAFLIEGFHTSAGAAFQMDALRMVSPVPVRAALDTHYHFDHSMGNAFYGAHNIPVWAHSKAASRIVESYASLQGLDRATFLASSEQRVRDARTDTGRQHAQFDLNATSIVFDSTNATVLALPNHPLDPAKLPVTLDLGGLSALLETYPGHSGTDVIVRVPDQNIVFTGDLLFNAWYPVSFDASISAWRKTLAQFASLGKDALFVPGHGQLCGQEGIALSRTVFDDLAEHAERMYKAGVPAAQAIERYTVPEKFKNMPIFAWGFTVGATITKLYDEWKTK